MSRIQITAKSPTISRTQADHSCVGRNLTVSCVQISANSPTISRTQADHSCVGRNLTVSCIQISANSPHNLLYTSRPFLRRQESHSVVCANIGKIAHNLSYTSRPFLRRQESQSIKGGNAASLRRRAAAIYAAVGGTRL